MGTIITAENAPKDYPLLGLRNRAVSWKSLRQTLAAFRSKDMPSLNDPISFTRQMLELEEKMGTCYAAMVGLFLATGTTDFMQIKQGIDLFENVCARIRAGVPNLASETELLFAFLNPFLVYTIAGSKDAVLANKGRSLFHGLESVSVNMDGGYQPVGNCQTCSVIFSLINLRFGNLAGRAKKNNSLHPLSYVENSSGEQYLFDVIADDVISRKAILGVFGNDDAWQQFFCTGELFEQILPSDEEDQVLAQLVNLDDVGLYFKKNIPEERIGAAVSDPQKRAFLIDCLRTVLKMARLKRFNEMRGCLEITSIFTSISAFLSSKISNLTTFALLSTRSEEEILSLMKMLAVAQAIEPEAYEAAYQAESLLWYYAKG